MKISYTPQDIPFIVENINCVSVTRPNGYKMTFAEGRVQHTFVYTLKGTMRFSFLPVQVRENLPVQVREDILAQSGDLVFIPAGTRYSSTYTADESSVIIVQFNYLSGDFPDALTAPCRITDESIRKIFCSLYSDLQSAQGLNSMYFLSQIYNLLWRITQQAGTLPGKYSRIQPALKDLPLSCFDSYKIQYYADLCGMSEPGFRRLFKAYTGLSPVEYRTGMRLDTARKLLKSGEFTIEEAAEKVGFANTSFFCRSYKKRFGHSPGKEC